MLSWIGAVDFDRKAIKRILGYRKTRDVMRYIGTETPVERLMSATCTESGCGDSEEHVSTSCRQGVLQTHIGSRTCPYLPTRMRTVICICTWFLDLLELASHICPLTPGPFVC